MRVGVHCFDRADILVAVDLVVAERVYRAVDVLALRAFKHDADLVVG